MVLPVTVWAQETTLTTNIPSVHTLHIELTGNGKIVVDGVLYEKTADIQIHRHSIPVISIEAENGWKIKSASFNNQVITEQIKSGRFAFPEMRYDAELIVVFEAQGGTPQTGDKSNIEILFLLMLLSVIGMILCVGTYRKTRTNVK